MGEKPGRNDPCPCGSGKKYKKCCYTKDQSKIQTAKIMTEEQSVRHVTDLMRKQVIQQWTNPETFNLPKFGPEVEAEEKNEVSETNGLEQK
ncbi:MAG: SEC-C domain-containing protein [Chlamydiia bacterium]|nr:SEC-C domain-containing protein [Chlamydiia bacterium]